MKVIVISKTNFNVTQYDNVSSILKSGTTITITVIGGSSATVNSTENIVRIIET